MSRQKYKEFDFREFTFELVRHQQAIAGKLGINLTDFKALGLLHRRGEMTPKELAETMGMSAAAMTTVVDRLEKASYVERKRHRADRRSVTVHPVEGSEHKVEFLYKSLLAASKTLLPAYRKKDRALISDFLARATEVFRAATAELLSSK